MANATPLCIPDTRIFPDTVPMGLGTRKHVKNMVYGLYNGTFNSQTDPTIPRFGMNLLDHMVMYLVYIHISNIFSIDLLLGLLYCYIVYSPYL